MIMHKADNVLSGEIYLYDTALAHMFLPTDGMICMIPLAHIS